MTPEVEPNNDWPEKFDAFMLLAKVKTHLANHKPMTMGDALAWELCDQAQAEVWMEEADYGTGL